MSLLHDTTSRWRDAHLAIKSVVRGGIDFEIGSEEKGGARRLPPACIHHHSAKRCVPLFLADG